MVPFDLATQFANAARVFAGANRSMRTSTRIFFYGGLIPLALLLVAVVTVGCTTKSAYQAEAHLKLTASIQGRADAQLIHSVTNLPVSIRDRLGFIADSGKRFEKGCVVFEGVPQQRFLAATRSDRLYTVAVEHGGAAYYWDMAEFILDSDGKIVSVGGLSGTLYVRIRPRRQVHETSASIHRTTPGSAGRA